VTLAAGEQKWHFWIHRKTIGNRLELNQSNRYGPSEAATSLFIPCVYPHFRTMMLGKYCFLWFSRPQACKICSSVSNHLPEEPSWPGRWDGLPAPEVEKGGHRARIFVPSHPALERQSQHQHASLVGDTTGPPSIGTWPGSMRFRLRGQINTRPTQFNGVPILAAEYLPTDFQCPSGGQESARAKVEIDSTPSTQYIMETAVFVSPWGRPRSNGMSMSRISGPSRKRGGHLRG
jgi:hypothetical protein